MLKKQKPAWQQDVPEALETLNTSETRLIQYIKRRFRRWKKHFSPWIGDDSSGLFLKGKFFISTDGSAEGVHFRRDLFPLKYAGYRALAGALSDLAACGCRPLGFFFTLGIPQNAEERDTKDLIDGIYKCSIRYHVPLGGGDIIASSEGFILNFTVFGQPYSKPFMRSNAKPGDKVLISGPTGLAALGLELIKRRQGLPFPRRLTSLEKHFLMPGPEFTLAHRIARMKITRIACIDTSDSLVESAYHLAKASGVKIILDLTGQMFPRIFVQACKKLDITPVDMFLWGGEDYRLMITAPPGKALEIKKIAKFMEIGEVVKGSGIQIFFESHPVKFARPKGFLHSFRFGQEQPGE